MIEKSMLTREGENVRFSVPLSKVNEEKRTVSGFASLDNLDQHDDIVPIEVARDAFIKFRGNLREMHQPIAVGKVVSFSEEQFYDEESGSVYNGIFVNSYVSKGAADTWEKVLDGTLSGFSIGGIIKGEKKVYDPETSKMTRVITGLELHELSLVDSPANQFANILSIQKSEDGLEASGIATGISMENVFWCENEAVAVISTDDVKKCSCGSDMTNIGWVESGDNLQDSVSSIVTKFLDAKSSKVDEKDSAEGTDATLKATGGVLTTASLENIVEEAVTRALANRGGVEELATEETTEATESTEETAEATEVAEVEEVSDETPVAKAVEVSEVEGEEAGKEESFDLAKAFESFASNVSDAISKISERLDAVTESLETVKSLGDEQAKISESLEGVKKDVSEVVTTVTDLTESTGRLEKATAVKKSGDLESTSEEPITRKSLWGGRFISSNALTD